MAQYLLIGWVTFWVGPSLGWVRRNVLQKRWPREDEYHKVRRVNLAFILLGFTIIMVTLFNPPS